MADDELDQWLRDCRPRGPLAHNLSMLDGFVSALLDLPVVSHRSGRLQYRGHPGVRGDQGGSRSPQRHHPTPPGWVGLKPIYHQKPNREVDAADWCEGFLAAVKLNQPLWNDLLNLDDIHHGLLLPILLYCKDTKGQPMLGPPREGPQTELFLSQAHTDIPPVVPAMREYFQEQRFSRPHPNASARS